MKSDFYIQVWFKCENGLQKKLFTKKQIFSVGFVKIKELHDVHTWRHM